MMLSLGLSFEPEDSQYGKYRLVWLVAEPAGLLQRRDSVCDTLNLD